MSFQSYGPLLASSPLWLTSMRAVSEGQACRDLTVYDAMGTPLLVARAFTWGRDIVVRDGGQSGAPQLLVRRRRSFPLTGKVDVLDTASERCVGLMHRNGRVWDPNGALVGRFADARSLRRRTAESVVEAVGTVIVGGDASAGSSPSGYTYTLGNRVMGGLVRAPLPFEVEPASSPSPIAAKVARFLPSKLGAALQGRRSHGWRFDRAAVAEGEDPRLSVAAAVFMVELSHW